MRVNRIVKWGAALLMAGGVAISAAAAEKSAAARGKPKIVVADPNEQGDGADRTRVHGALLRSPAVVEAVKDRAVRGQFDSSETTARGPQAPTIFGGHNLAGMFPNPNVLGTPPDNQGAIGPTRYIQILNTTGVRIINRTSHAIIGAGTLNRLAGVASSVTAFDPQIIWDPTTRRFYYAMDTIFGVTDNRVSFGFSKTAKPANATTDWCHYHVKSYDSLAPDYPKLGDSRYFMLIGVNVFADFSGGPYIGSDIIAISKPPAGTTCPTASSLEIGIEADLKDSGGSLVFTPVPSNQIDNNGTGYVVSIDGDLFNGFGANQLWFFNVTKGATGEPVFGAGRGSQSQPMIFRQTYFSRMAA